MAMNNSNKTNWKDTVGWKDIPASSFRLVSLDDNVPFDSLM